MLKALMDLFAKQDASQPQINPELAAAALLVEVMAADDQWQSCEENAIRSALLGSLQISAADCDAMLAEAKSQQRNAHDYYELTRQINDHFTSEQKYQLILNMWKVAWADGELDRYEDNTIRKVAELIYVPHNLFIKAKLAAKPA